MNGGENQILYNTTLSSELNEILSYLIGYPVKNWVCVENIIKQNQKPFLANDKCKWFSKSLSSS